MHKLTFILIFFVAQNAFGFIQNTTHGYPSCVACHVSPNGGALLSDYGRSLSNELMSTWDTGDAFSQPLFGMLKNTDRIKYGGDIRAIQSNLKNNNVDSGKLFLMQQNIELGVNVDNVIFVGSFGTQEGPDGTPKKGQFLSERHYALWSPTPTSRLRVGKYRQTFGIFTDNHARLIKDGFGFGSLSETYNLEYTQFYETHEIIVGASLGRIDNPQSNNTEKNISGHYVHYLQGQSRVGGSLLFGESNGKRRLLTGANAVVPLGKEWIGIFEIDYEKSYLSVAPDQGVDTIASLSRVGYTPVKGLMGYFVFEHFSAASDTSYTLVHQPGLGIQWLPIAHFNIQLEYLRQVRNDNYSNPNNIAFLVFHTYL